MLWSGRSDGVACFGVDIKMEFLHLLFASFYRSSLWNQVPNIVIAPPSRENAPEGG